MARTNYSYEKRGRELEKQKKKEEKRQKKMAKRNEGTEETQEGETTPPQTEDLNSVPSADKEQNPSDT